VKRNSFHVIACDKREAFAQGSDNDEAIHSSAKKVWIASRSLSSGAHSRDPLARNDGREARSAVSEDGRSDHAELSVMQSGML